MEWWTESSCKLCSYEWKPEKLNSVWELEQTKGEHRGKPDPKGIIRESTGRTGNGNSREEQEKTRRRKLIRRAAKQRDGMV